MAIRAPFVHGRDRPEKRDRRLLRAAVFAHDVRECALLTSLSRDGRNVGWLRFCRLHAFVPTEANDERLGLVQRIRAEFYEAPGLDITLDEGVRFWALDAETCECVLTRLHEMGFLLKTHDGHYRRRRTV